jgi:hypothetical protein
VVAVVLVAAVDGPAELVGGNHIEYLVGQGRRLLVPLIKQLRKVMVDYAAPRSRQLRGRRGDGGQVPLGIGNEIEGAREGGLRR